MIVLSADYQQWKTHAVAAERDWWRGHQPPHGPDTLRLSQLLAERFGLSQDTFAGLALLDVGCGPTGLLSWFDRPALAAAIDPLADEYRQRYPATVAWYHELHTHPAEKYLPLHAGRYDWIVSFNALDHGYSISRSIANLARYLKPGGRLLLSVGCDLINPPCQCHMLKLHPQAVTALLDAVGIRIDRQEQGALPTGEGGEIRLKDICSGGPVFHWFGTRPKEPSPC
jgi:SAM-dependent methyltransferase